VLEEILRAFPATRTKPFSALVNSPLGDEPAGVAQAFRDKADWTELDGDWLEQHPEALHFLSNEAICFYIPAFIAADLKGQLRSSDAVFALTHGFAHGIGDTHIRGDKSQTWGAYARERWSGLTTPQARAVVQYLEWRGGARSAPLEQETIAEALASYWRARAGTA
jgi:hypothetical protein